MKKIKVLYIVSTLDKTGPINILYGIVKNINMNLFDLNIITLASENKSSRKEDFLNLGINIKQLNFSRVKMWIFGRKSLFNIINNIQPDIIHSHGFRADKYSAQYSGVSTFTTIHNYPHIDYLAEYGKLIGTIMYKLQLKYITKIQYPIACSKSISQELKEKFNLSTYSIPNGINIELYTCILDNSGRIELKKQLNLPLNKKILISVGNLNERKNPLFLIECFLESSLKKDYCLIILGDGVLAEKCREIASENILLVGKVDNVRDYLAISDLYISSSKAEGLPNSVLEAMSMEIPVVISKIPPHEEILEFSNEAGILFELEKGELVRKLNTIDSMDFEKSGAMSKLIVEKNYSDKKMSRQYEKMYLRALKIEGVGQ